MSASVEAGSIVERGEARCPRCMAVAEYAFHEADGGILRYEVSCSACSHVYCETCTSPESFAA